ncbi:MAG: Vgb family protein [Actinomycetota bacterium]
MPEAGRKRSARAVAAAIGIVLVAAPMASCERGGSALPTGPSPSAQPLSGVVRIDPGTNTVVTTIELSRPNVVEAGLGYVWVTNNQFNSATVVRIDPDSAAISPIELGPATAVNADDLAVGRDGVWALIGDTVFRLDPVVNEVTGTVAGLAPGGLLSGAVASGTSLWVADTTAGTVERIDAATDRVVDVIPVGAPTDGIAIGQGAVWVTNSLEDTLTRIDPVTREVVGTVDVPGAAGFVAVGAGRVWIPDPTGNTVAVFDPATNRLETIRVGRGPTGIAFGADAVWVANTKDGTVSRIDPETRDVVATIDVGGDPYSIAAGPEGVWVTLLSREAGEH